MRYEYKKSFDRTFKKLSASQKQAARKAVWALIDFFETGHKPKGLGLKNLRQDFWEIRAGLKIRIIFLFEKDLVSFLIVGTHDQISKYLSNY